MEEFMNISKIVLLSLSLVSSVGFAQAKEPISFNADVTTFKTIHVKVGQEFLIKIPGFRGGVYWQASRDLAMLDLIKERNNILIDDVLNPRYETHFTFKALKPGSTDLSFKTVFMMTMTPNQVANFTVIVE